MRKKSLHNMWCLWYIGIFLRRNMFFDEKTHQLHISQFFFPQQLWGGAPSSSNIQETHHALLTPSKMLLEAWIDRAGKGLIHAWSLVNSVPTIPRDFCWCHIGLTEPMLLGGKVSSWCLNKANMGVFGSRYHHVWVFVVTGSQTLIAEPFCSSVLISRWNSKIAAWKKKKQKNNNTNTNTNDDNAKRRWQNDVWFLFPWDHLDRADLEWSLRYQHLSTTALQLQGGSLVELVMSGESMYVEVGPPCILECWRMTCLYMKHVVP